MREIVLIPALNEMLLPDAGPFGSYLNISRRMNSIQDFLGNWDEVGPHKARTPCTPPDTFLYTTNRRASLGTSLGGAHEFQL